MKANKKTITTIMIVLAIVVSCIAVVLCLMFLKQEDKKVVPFVNPIVENRTYYIDDTNTTLPEITLSAGDTQGTISWVGGQEIIEGVKAYKWRFTPIKSKIYQELEGSINLTFAQKQNIRVPVIPVTSKLTYGLNLSNSSFTGGRVVPESNNDIVVSGTWSWLNPYLIPEANENNQFFSAIFTPHNDLYKTTKIKVPIKVDKRDIIITPTYDQYKFSGDEDPELSYHIIGNVIGETPKFEGSLEREAGEDIGVYPISLGSLSLVSDPDNNFNKDNYNLTLNNNVDYEFKFRIYEKVKIYSIKIGDVALKENENVDLKQYDGKSITAPVIYHNIIFLKPNISYRKVNDSNVTTQLKFSDIIDPGDYEVMVSLGYDGVNNDIRYTAFKYYFTIKKADIGFNPPSKITVNYTAGMTLNDVVLDNSSQDFTLSWLSDTSSPITANANNEFTVLLTPSNTALYQTQTFNVNVYADSSSTVVPVVFNGLNCSAEGYIALDEEGEVIKEYDFSCISGEDTDYKLKINFDKNYGSYSNLSVTYRYKTTDGTIISDTLSEGYYSFVYNQNYNNSKTSDDFTDYPVDYLVYQSNSANATSYLDLSLDYFYINAEGINFLKNNNATVVINLDVGVSNRWVRKLANGSIRYDDVKYSNTIISENLYPLNSQWYSPYKSSYLYYRTADKSSGLFLDYYNCYERNSNELGVENDHLNLYIYNKASNFKVTYHYKYEKYINTDTKQTIDEILFRSNVSSGSYVNVSYGKVGIDTGSMVADFDIEGIDKIPVGWSFYEGGEIYSLDNNFLNLGADVDLYLVTIDPFIVKFKTYGNNEVFEDRLISTNKELSEAVNYGGLKWRVSLGNGEYKDTDEYSYFSLYKYIFDGELILYCTNTEPEELQGEVLSSDDMIIGTWSNEYAKYETRASYLKVNVDGTFTFVYTENNSTTYYTGIVYSNNKNEDCEFYSLNFLNNNGGSLNYNGSATIYKNELVYDEILEEYVYNDCIRIVYNSGTSVGYFYKTDTDFKILNIINKDSLTSSTFISQNIIFLTDNDYNENKTFRISDYIADCTSMYFYKGFNKREAIALGTETTTLDGVTISFYTINYSNFGDVTEIYALSIPATDSNITGVNATVKLLNNKTYSLRLYNKLQSEGDSLGLEIYKVVNSNKPEGITAWSYIGFKLKYTIDTGNETSTEYEKYYTYDYFNVNNGYGLSDLITDAISTGVNVEIYPIIRTSNFEFATKDIIGKKYQTIYDIKYTEDTENKSIQNTKTIWFDSNGDYYCNFDNDSLYRWGSYDFDEKTNIGHFDGVLSGMFKVNEAGNIVFEDVNYNKIVTEQE